MRPALSIATAAMLPLLPLPATGDARQTAITPRLGGGPLPLSLRNEADAAMARARRWLLRRQQPDGGWGMTNRLLLTALAALALTETPAGGASPAVAEGRAKAFAWLASGPAATNPPPDLAALAWREIALTVAGARTSADDAATAAFRRAVAAPHASLPPEEDGPPARLAVTEACLLLGLPPPWPPPDPAADLPAEPAEAAAWLALRKADPAEAVAVMARLARSWETPGTRAWRAGDAQRAWRLARAINRHGRGELAAPADDARPLLTVDWRHQMAREWIGRQRVDTRGDGWWDPRDAGGGATAATDEDRNAETAFSILLLGEL